ncbi:MAG: hypothetical protein DWH87_02890 [Planctomycetota bacterium]|nr:MAG: hypothetical protein DWH87_02890 [Planctomycetota bacterium]
MRTNLSDAADGTDVVPGYRPVSVLAVFALLAGILSATAVFSPALLLVPLIASALSVVALKDVSAHGDERAEGGDRKTGRWCALAGLALAVGFGVQSVATNLTQRTVAFRRAEASAAMFLEMVREDRLGEAVKTCLPQVIPPMGIGVGAKATPDVQERQAEASLAGMEVIQDIRKCGRAAATTLRCVGAEVRFPDSWAVVVVIDPCEGRSRPLEIRMLMQSKPVTRGQRIYDNWMVAGIAPNVGQ